MTNQQDTVLLVANALLAADAFFKVGKREDAMSMLVVAEQNLAHVDDARLFLRFTLHAQRIWAAYLIDSCLTVESTADLAMDHFEIKKAS